MKKWERVYREHRKKWPPLEEDGLNFPRSESSLKVITEILNHIEEEVRKIKKLLADSTGDK